MSLPQEPYSRIERYLAKLAGQEVDIPDKPITRIECYLDYIVNNGGGVLAANAGAHNAIFRGRSLGTEFTADQSSAIHAGTFDGLFVGDYWTINDTVYRIAGFDLFYQRGYPSVVADHHIVMVPDGPLYSAAMNPTATTEGGYVGSELKTAGLADALSAVSSAFGSDHILEYRNRINTGLETGDWVPSKIDLCNAISLVGNQIVAFRSSNIGLLSSQFPLFMLAPQYIRLAKATPESMADYWIADITSASNFLSVNTYTYIVSAPANSVKGVRPYFCLA